MNSPPNRTCSFHCIRLSPYPLIQDQCRLTKSYGTSDPDFRCTIPSLFSVRLNHFGFKSFSDGRGAAQRVEGSFLLILGREPSLSREGGSLCLSAELFFPTLSPTVQWLLAISESSLCSHKDRLTPFLCQLRVRWPFDVISAPGSVVFSSVLRGLRTPLFFGESKISLLNSYYNGGIPNSISLVLTHLGRFAFAILSTSSPRGATSFITRDAPKIPGEPPKNKCWTVP